MQVLFIMLKFFIQIKLNLSIIMDQASLQFHFFGNGKMTKKPILSIDFDGVIHSYTSGWIAVDIIPDPPVPGAFEALIEYAKFFKICIFSSRSASILGRAAMKKWFQTHGWECGEKRFGDLVLDIMPKHLDFPDSKPAAFLTIDDRAILFQGFFPPAETLLQFKPWHKKGV